MLPRPARIRPAGRATMGDVRIRLAIMQFGQFFTWGAWLVTVGAYGVETLGLSGTQVGLLFTVMGVAALVMPGVVGLLADTRVDATRLYAGLQAVAGVGLLAAASATGYAGLFWAMVVITFAYMPTVSLGYAAAYAILEREGRDPVHSFPAIRAVGTVGFIAAMWTVSLAGWELSRAQFVVAGVSGLALAAYSLTLPACPPPGRTGAASWRSVLGLGSLRFLRDRTIGVFLVFACLLGTLLSVSSTWTDDFLHSFASTPAFTDSFAVQYPALLISLSQVSEVAFILSIPFFLGRFGIKVVMLMSFAAWAIRFTLLGVGNPGPGLLLLVAAMIVYGAAFDFFNVSGSLYLETVVPAASRGSAQGAFNSMVNGWGAIVGGLLAGWLYDSFTVDGATDWTTFWFVCAGYAVVLAVAFTVLFRPAGSRVSQDLPAPAR